MFSAVPSLCLLEHSHYSLPGASTPILASVLSSCWLANPALDFTNPELPPTHRGAENIEKLEYIVSPKHHKAGFGGEFHLDSARPSENPMLAPFRVSYNIIQAQYRPYIPGGVLSSYAFIPR